MRVTTRVRAKLREVMSISREQLAATRSLGEAVRSLREEVSELHRIVVGQGEAADQTAEVLGRTLSHLAAELARLSERLDPPALDDSPSESP
jgi:molybdopterin converting factor small subunit